MQVYLQFSADVNEHRFSDEPSASIATTAGLSAQRSATKSLLLGQFAEAVGGDIESCHDESFEL